MIVLDWTRPWTFVEELETWLSWVEQWAKGDGSRELEITREESRERRAFDVSCSCVTLFLETRAADFDAL